MTNEAVCLIKPTIIRRYTVYDTPGIAKGAVLKLSGPNQVGACVTVGAFGGIAVEEKTASDGIVNIGCAMDGEWDMYAGGGTTISVGELVQLSGPNTIEGDVNEAGIIAGQLVGRALEAVTVGTAATIRVQVGYY